MDYEAFVIVRSEATELAARENRLVTIVDGNYTWTVQPDGSAIVTYAVSDD